MLLPQLNFLSPQNSIGSASVKSKTMPLTANIKEISSIQLSISLDRGTTFARLSSLSTTIGGLPLPEGTSTWVTGNVLNCYPTANISYRRRVFGISESCIYRSNFPIKCTAVSSCYPLFIALDGISILDERESHFQIFIRL